MPSKFPTYVGSNGVSPNNYPPRKAELYPKIVIPKTFSPPPLVREEAILSEKKDAAEAHPKSDEHKEA